LAELESEKWRKTIGDLLVELTKEEIQPLTKFLSHPKSSVICQILSILGKIAHPSTMKYLGGLTTHGDAKVREETLQVLFQFGKKSAGLIVRYLKDSVPDIRSKASLLLARVAKEEAAEPLMKIILSEDFYKRGYEEKVSFFRALGETGSKGAIPVLKELATKRKLFQREKWEEMRICAANALKMIESRDEARSPWAKDSSPPPESRMH
jgi:HEAT repeat protein